MKKKIVLRIIFICMFIFVLGFIYYNSSKDFDTSNQISYKVLDKVQGIITKIYGEDIESYKLNLLLRKFAHAFEFFILAMVAIIVFKSLRISSINSIIYSLFIVLLWAVFDEYHQIGVPGRNSRVTDVIIDFCGGTIGAMLVSVVYSIKNMVKILLSRKK